MSELAQRLLPIIQEYGAIEFNVLWAYMPESVSFDEMKIALGSLLEAGDIKQCHSCNAYTDTDQGEQIEQYWLCFDCIK